MHDPEAGIAYSTHTPPVHPFGSPTIPTDRDSWLCVPRVAACLFEDEEERPAKRPDSSGHFAPWSSHRATAREPPAHDFHSE